MRFNSTPFTQRSTGRPSRGTFNTMAANPVADFGQILVKHGLGKHDYDPPE
jgi:hypothetical protein